MTDPNQSAVDAFSGEQPFDGVELDADANDRTERLWDGDTGALPDASRRVLLRLVRGPYVSGAREARLWSSLLVDEQRIRSHLADLFLELVIDRENEFAFVRNAPSDDAPRAVNTRKLTFLDTAMLLVLRQALLAEDGHERVYVGKAEVAEQLAVFRSADRDETDFSKRINASWSTMLNSLRVMHAVGDDRAELSPVLRLIVDADQVRAITEEYRRIAAEGGATVDDDAMPIDEEDAS